MPKADADISLSASGMIFGGQEWGNSFRCDPDKVTPVCFRTFSVSTRDQLEGRNPRTGEKIKIPASKVVKFKAGKSLSEKM